MYILIFTLVQMFGGILFKKIVLEKKLTGNKGKTDSEIENGQILVVVMVMVIQTVRVADVEVEIWEAPVDLAFQTVNSYLLEICHTT